MANHRERDFGLAATALFLSEADPQIAEVEDSTKFRDLGLSIAREAGFSEETLEKIMLQAPGVLPSYLQLLSERPDVDVVDLTRFGRNLGFVDAEDTARLILGDLEPEEEEEEEKEEKEEEEGEEPVEQILGLLAPRLEKDQERTNTAVSNTLPGLLTRGELGR